MTTTSMVLVLLGELPAPEPVRQAAWNFNWLLNPRSGVLLVMVTIVGVGLARKWLQSSRARQALERLDASDVSTEEIEDLSQHGRSGLMDLFRLLEHAPDAQHREAAGRGLARLWKQDELVAEEEKAIVSRGFGVHWTARRRYPREMTTPIPIVVSYGVPFLHEEGPGVRPGDLVWSHRIYGAERASLESFSPWTAGPGTVAFTLQPEDFPTNGPHRLVLQTRVRTNDLTSSWEMDLPHVPFSFEFDPNLSVEALLTMPDATRAEAIARAIRLESPENAAAPDPSTFLDLNERFALRNPPELVVQTPLPSDLAHGLSVELEGVPGTFPAGEVVLSGQGTGEGPPGEKRFPLGPIVDLPTEAIERPGPARLRVHLAADPLRGWAEPEIRSIWPETITTEWIEVRIVRR